MAAGGQVRPGLEVLLGDRLDLLKGSRVGLVAHPASVDRRLRHAADLLHETAGVEFAALFGPQHGLWGETQDNMVEWEGESTHPLYKCPVHSLYGETREPRREWLEDLDVLLVDLQDVGTRIYTYASTLFLCMQAAARAGVRVVVADRPDPIGGEMVEGNALAADHVSFVGPSPGVVVRHGLTLGEMALWFLEQDGLDVELEVAPCEGWDRSAWFDETGLPWVLPSPNMPTLKTAALFPGMVALEGTTASEGRGTTRPFEIVGHPEVDGRELAATLEAEDLPGVLFRPHAFLPTFQKHAGVLCGGIQAHVTDREAFRPVRTGYAVLLHLYLRVGEGFWKAPPYEYVEDRPPIDVITGSALWRNAAEAGTPAAEFAASWEEDEGEFREVRRPCLLYG